VEEVPGQIRPCDPDRWWYKLKTRYVVSKRPWFLLPCEDINDFLCIDDPVYSGSHLSTIHPCYFIHDINRKDKKAVKIFPKK